MDPHDGREHKHWKLLVKEGPVDEVVLQPESFLSVAEIKKLKHKYYPEPEKIPTTITRDTLFWYPPGLYSRDRQIAALYLQRKISQVAQDEALEGFRKMAWEDPHRAETETAIKRQKGNVAPGELLFGWTDQASIEKTHAFEEQPEAFNHLGRILTEMNTIYSRSLSLHFGEQNRPKSEEERWEERKKKGMKPGPEYGGILKEVRIELNAFSTITCLKSCPAAIHTDSGNASKDQTSFTCLTTVREPDFEGGGEFCFIEYGLKVPVKPGDILIGQTTREWHLNITPVRGTKYSLVAYYRRKNLANPLMWENRRKRDSVKKS